MYRQVKSGLDVYFYPSQETQKPRSNTSEGSVYFTTNKFISTIRKENNSTQNNSFIVGTGNNTLSFHSVGQVKM